MRRGVVVAVTAAVFLVAGALAALAASGGQSAVVDGVDPAATESAAGSTPSGPLGPDGRDCDSGTFLDCEGDELEALALQDPAGAIERYHSLAASNPKLRESCHFLFHRIGRGAAQGERDAWEAFMAGTSECNWGYIHGAVEGALDLDYEAIVVNASELCAIPADLDETDQYVQGTAGNCVHGTGHALMRSGAEPTAAEQGCRSAFERVDDLVSCVDGMIMEVGNRATIGESRYLDLCANIGDDVKATCYGSIGLVWLRANDFDFPAAYAQCAEAAPVAKNLEKCSWGLGGIHAFSTGFDFDLLTATCTNLGEHLDLGCYFGVVASGAQGVYSQVITEAEFDAFVATAPGHLRDRVEAEAERIYGQIGVPSPSVGG